MSVCLSLLQYDEWNSHDRMLMGYIKTKSKPSIFYLPVEHNETTEHLLKQTQEEIEGTFKLDIPMPSLYLRYIFRDHFE